VTYVDSRGKGLIDVIYIDPPYNTEKSKEEGNDYKEEVEAKKFIYRDKFTRDGWLNMMNERLKLAKKLLSDKGVIFISIDDTEQAYLKVLCDEIFGESNFIVVFNWQTTDGAQGIPTKQLVSPNHEYVLCYTKDKNAGFKFAGLGRQQDSGFKNPDNDARGRWKRQYLQRFGLGFTEKTIIDPKTNISFTFETPYTQDNLNDMIKDNRIIFPKQKTQYPAFKEFLSEYENNRQITSSLGLYPTKSFTEEFNTIFNGKRVFNNPKPVPLIKFLIKQANNVNATILDFFAGSGTTGQAVMELNAEDEGNRKFVLVTNNENNIATNITRERLYRVINGKGSKGEKIEWEYSKEKKSLTNNTVRVFDIKTENLTIADVEKAERIKTEAEKDFKKLNEKYQAKDDLYIYTQLTSLNPYKSEK
jgi:adenine-specific DNA-methyltransferase